jgi:hypothetical protein
MRSILEDRAIPDLTTSLSWHKARLDHQRHTGRHSEILDLHDGSAGPDASRRAGKAGRLQRLHTALKSHGL